MGRLRLTVVGVLALLPAQERPAFRLATDIVPIYVSVFTRDGTPVRDLRETDFEVADNGRRRDIAVFSNEVQPISVAIVMDRSSSNFTQIPWAARGLKAFISTMRPDDRASISTLAGVQVGPTSDREVLLRTIESWFPNDASSPIWDAIDRTLTVLSTQPQRRIVLMLTDGQDNSLRPVPQDLLRKSERDLISMYAVDFERPINLPVTPTEWQRQRDRAREQLENVVRQSGGEFFLLKEGSTDVEGAFARIAEGLRTQYLIGFSGGEPDGKVHRLDVRVNRRGATVRVRGTYLSVHGK